MIELSFTYLQLGLGIYATVAILVYLFFLFVGACGPPEGCLGPLFISISWPLWVLAFIYDRIFHRKK